MKLLLSICFVILYFVSIAQRGLIQFSSQEGLISNETRGVEIDKDGFIWIATSKGIDRFDGQRFIHFTHNRLIHNSISSNDIQHIVFDDKQTVWATTFNKGLIRINTKSLYVQNFSKKNIPSFGSNYISAIKPLGDSVWYTSMDGELFVFNHQTKQTKQFQLPQEWKNAPPFFTSIYHDKISTHKLWITSSRGLFCFDINTKKWRLYEWGEKTDLSDSKPTTYENRMSVIEQDSKGNLYIGLKNGKLLYFDQFQGLFKQFIILTEENTKQHISSIRWFDSRYLYLCLFNGEICLFDTTKKKVVRYTESERKVLYPNSIATLGSQLVIASTNSGIFLHDNSIIYGQKIMTDEPIYSIQYSEDKTTAYKLVGKGNYKLQKIKGTGPSVIPIPELISPSSFSILSNKTIVLTGLRRIFVVQPSGKIKSKAMNFDFNSAEIIDDTMIYIGTKDSRLIRVNLNDFSSQTIYKSSIYNAISGESEFFPIILCKYKDQLVFSERERIFLYDFLAEKISPINIFKQEDSDIITSMTTIQSDLWIGTKASGIWKYNLNTKKITSEIKSLQNIQNSEVKQLMYDEDHLLWILTPQFISIYDVNTESAHMLEKQNGISNIEKIINGKSKYYFIQSNSYIETSKESKLPIKKKAIPYLLQIYQLNNWERLPKTKHHFEYTQNSLVFEYGVQDYSNFENKQISYRLVGLDEKWINGNQRNEALYYNLKGGNYEFQIKVTDGKNASVYSFHFFVAKPFWKSWWFITLSVILLFIGIWIYIQTRVKRVRKTEQMKLEYNMKINELESKALRAQMNPHFLFNSLNSIRLFILKNEVDSAADYIAKFSKLLRMILNYSRQDMITVYDEIQSLKLYLEFERLRFDQDFDFDLQIDGQSVLDCQIPPMIIQPFIENAIWHGLMPRNKEGGKIRVSFQKQQSGLYVMVQDNGIGRQKAKGNNRKRSLKEGSVGLQITKERLMSLSMRTKRQNDFEIEDLIDENGQAIGTLVTLHFETAS